MIRSFFTGLILFLGSLTYAQQAPSRCYTADYYKAFYANHPDQALAHKNYQDQIDQWIAQHRSRSITTDSIYNVPVVVHVVYYTGSQNISDEQIFSQIDVLNEDYRRINEDTSDTPVEFAPVAADCGITFCLAAFDPYGLPTNGITRTETDKTFWPLEEIQNVTLTDSGGVNGWPSIYYLNIWVCNMDGNVLGISSMPFAGSAWDGCIINYSNFGRTGVVTYPYSDGRTGSHEVGHWLGLYHVWGDDGGSCSGTDHIDDTPNQAKETYHCPAFPLTDPCSPESPGVMFMNYMDYTDDACMNIFTQGQKAVMRATLEGYRSLILTSAAGCSYSGGGHKPGNVQGPSLNIYPDPGSGLFNCNVINFLQGEIHIQIFNDVGQLLREYATGEPAFTFDITGFPAGNYFMRVYNDATVITKEFMLAH